MPTGGTFWDTPFGNMNEAELLSIYLKREGVSEDSIVKEEQATTTKENMLFGAVLIMRNAKKFPVRRIAIVTSTFHMRRSMQIADNYLPRHYELVSYSAHPEYDYPEKWFEDEYRTLRVRNEVINLRRNIVNGVSEDIEF